MPRINELLGDHVTLEVGCLDRVYLNGYIHTLQLPDQLIALLVQHCKQKISSPALLHQMTQKSVKNIKRYAEENHVPVVYFEHRKRTN